MFASSGYAVASPSMNASPLKKVFQVYKIMSISNSETKLKVRDNMPSNLE